MPSITKVNISIKHPNSVIQDIAVNNLSPKKCYLDVLVSKSKSIKHTPMPFTISISAKFVVFIEASKYNFAIIIE